MNLESYVCEMCLYEGIDEQVNELDTQPSYYNREHEVSYATGN